MSATRLVAAEKITGGMTLASGDYVLQVGFGAKVNLQVAHADGTTGRKAFAYGTDVVLDWSPTAQKALADSRANLAALLNL